MGLFKNKHTSTATIALDEPKASWPDDSIDTIDDDAFAQAIAAGRTNEHDARITVAA